MPPSSARSRKGSSPKRVLLLPKLRRQFAEFLNHSSPARLSILYPPTCVGMGYGHRDNSLLGFSWQHGISDFAVCRSASRLSVTAQSLIGTHLHAYPGIYHRPGSSILLRPPSAIRQQLGRFASRRRTAPTLPLLDLARSRWYWNINQLCIDYAFRPRLSSRLTLGGLAFPRNPWAFGGGVSHPSLATHACILTRWRSTHRSRSRFAAPSTLLYRSRLEVEKPIASAQDLSPVTLSAQDHSTSELLRTLSRVAASKPTSWLSVQSHIVFHLVLN